MTEVLQPGGAGRSFASAGLGCPGMSRGYGELGHGDAESIAVVHRAFAVRQAPVVFLVRNNGFAVFVPLAQQTAAPPCTGAGRRPLSRPLARRPPPAPAGVARRRGRSRSGTAARPRAAGPVATGGVVHRV
ncbi:hypothetical protein ACF1GT_27695 [Streptomyces sp. NPDC014636]|uniref:hypothetical protein n=1 Tax=Streptomyces sp. NPDC014636 TaxID=3364876 RepID=UPI0036F67BFD